MFLNDDQVELLTQMCSALVLKPEEMALVLGVNQDEFLNEYKNPSGNIYNIRKAEYLKRKTKIFNGILDCAERDSSEAQKIAIKLFNAIDSDEYTY
jgi:CO dehydrogenase/acetyl-CoA synthase beta subunit